MSSDHLFSAVSDIAEALRHLKEAGRCLQRAARNINVLPTLPESIDDSVRSEMNTIYQSHRELVVLLHERTKDDIATLQGSARFCRNFPMSFDCLNGRLGDNPVGASR